MYQQLVLSLCILSGYTTSMSNISSLGIGQSSNRGRLLDRESIWKYENAGPSKMGRVGLYLGLLLGAFIELFVLTRKRALGG